jgi:hypothetical protein
MPTKTYQTFMVALQSPYIIRMLTSTDKSAIKTQVSLVDSRCILNMALF